MGPLRVFRKYLPLGVAISLHLFLLSIVMSSYAPVFDEVGHYAASIALTNTGVPCLYAVNPPLVHYVAGVASAQENIRVNRNVIDEKTSDRPESVVGQSLFREHGIAALQSLRRGRMACFLFAILGICLVYFSAYEQHGNEAGFIAAMQWALCPSMVAYGGLLLTDVPSAAVGFFAVLSMQHWIHTPNLSASIVVGLASGFACLTKFTWFPVLAGLLLFSVVQAALLRKNDGLKAVKEIICGLVVATLTGIYLINSFYAFEGTGKALGQIEFVSDVLTETEFGVRHNRFSNSTFRNIPVPFPERMVKGIDIQKRDFESGYRSYFAGEWKSGGWWYYYVAAFILKTPLPALFLILFGVLREIQLLVSIRPKCDSVLLNVIAPSFVFIIVSAQTGFNHHLRYVLPAFPFLFVISSQVVNWGRWSRRFVYLMLAWQFVIMIMQAPHWMSYFNELGGGPKRGHDWLVDSNIDWGQDVLRLKSWQEQNPSARPLNVAVYSMLDPKDLGLVFSKPAPFVLGHPEVSNPDGLRGPQAGWYAISVNHLKGICHFAFDGHGSAYLSMAYFTYFLDNFEPIDMIGYSIYIYHITEEDATRVRAKLLAEEAEFLKTEGVKAKAERLHDEK